MSACSPGECAGKLAALQAARDYRVNVEHYGKPARPEYIELRRADRLATA